MPSYCKSSLDLSDNLYIYRYGNGIKLIKPHLTEKRNTRYFYNTGHTIASAFNLPLNIGFLDTEGIVKKINQASAITLGLSSIQSAIGISIFDIATGKTAGQVAHNDKHVMQSEKTMIFEELVICKNEISIHRLQINSPWYNDEDKVIGVFGCNIILEKQSLSESLTHLMQLGLLSSINDNFHNNRFNLTKRESEIVNHTIHGKSAKVIAAILNISLRTVEQHLQNIKMKMGVLSKTALIEKAIDCGTL